MPPDPFRGLGLHLLVASLLPLVSGQLGDWETTALCIHDSSCQLPYVTISTSFHLDANTRHTWIYLIVYFSTATRPEPALYMTFFFQYPTRTRLKKIFLLGTVYFSSSCSVSKRKEAKEPTDGSLTQRISFNSPSDWLRAVLLCST